MARTQPLAALLCATLLAAAFSPAAAQLLAQGPVAQGPATAVAAPGPVDETNIANSGVAAAEPGTDIATGTGGTIGSGTSTVPLATAAPGGAARSPAVAAPVSANRTVGTQLVVPPNGCLIVSVTAASGSCLQDASFAVNSQRIATIPDYQQSGIAGSSRFFSNASYAANNSACAAAGPSVTQVYESDGCILATAAEDTVGASAATDIRNSFVCGTMSTQDTTNYARAFGATAQERRLCAAVTRGISGSISSGSGAPASGDPCTAPRATYIITNPCPDFNTTVNTTARFFLADEAPLAPPPVLLEPPAAAPAPEETLTPVTAPGLADAPAPDAVTADAPGPAGGDLAPATAPATAPAPAPQAACRTAAFGGAAALLAAAVLAVVA